LNDKIDFLNETTKNFDLAINNDNNFNVLIERILQLKYTQEKINNSMKILNHLYKYEDEELIDVLCYCNIEQENNFKKIIKGTSKRMLEKLYRNLPSISSTLNVRIFRTYMTFWQRF
jgi:hypothetical protein